MHQPLIVVLPKIDPPKPLTITVPAYYVFWWPKTEADQQLMRAVRKLENVEAVVPEGEGYRLDLRQTSPPFAERVMTRLLDLLGENDRSADRVIVRS